MAISFVLFAKESMKFDVQAIVGALEAEHGCSREAVIAGLQDAFAAAIKKLYRTTADVNVYIDHKTGEVRAFISGEAVDLTGLKRISFHEVRSMFLRRLSEFKEGHIKSKYGDKIGTLLSCKVIKDESEHVLLETSDRMPALLLRKEQVPGENYMPNSFIKALLVDFMLLHNETYILVSRRRDEFIKALLELEIPDIREGRCNIVKVARDPGYRTKVLIKPAEGSKESIGACLGYQGSRIRNIVEELNGERIDIINWSADEKELVKNSLKPVEIADIICDSDNRCARVYVDRKQLSQAIGRGGRNVKLASRLMGWEIDVFELPESAARSKAKSGEAL